MFRPTQALIWELPQTCHNELISRARELRHVTRTKISNGIRMLFAFLLYLSTITHPGSDRKLEAKFDLL